MTVQTAIDASVAGDEIWVKAATYVESITPKSSVPLYGGFAGTETERGQRSWNANPTVLDGGGASVVVTSLYLNIVVNGFTIRNGGDGVTVTGGALGGKATIADCVISGNTGAGVTVNSTGSATITNSVISGNGYGVLAGGSTTVRNCILTGNTTGVYAGLGQGVRSVANCVVAWNGTGIGKLSSATLGVSYSDVFGNTTANYSGLSDLTGTGGNISQDPRFFNRGSGDLRLRGSSPCRNAGNDAPVAYGETDIEGFPRIAGAHVDMGAYEDTGLRFVSANGAAPNSGRSWAAAFTRIGDAVSHSAEGDEIWVGYPEPTASAYWEKVIIDIGVAIYGGFAGTETARDQRDWTTTPTSIDGNGEGDVVTSTGNGVVLDGCTIRNGGNALSMVAVTRGTATIRNSSISGGDKGPYHGVRVSAPASADVISCIISGIHPSGLYVDGGTVNARWSIFSENTRGIDVQSGTASVANCTLQNNHEGLVVASGNATIASSVSNGSSSTGVLVTGGNTNITNCTISGGGFGASFYGGTSAVTNSIAAFNQRGIYRDNTGVGLTLSHNDVYGNSLQNYAGIANPTGVDGNIGQDPLFSNPATADYSLRMSSPCIDAGDDAFVIPGQLAMGEQERILGARVDIGAYEANWPAPFTFADIRKAIAIASGTAVATSGNMSWLNLVPSAPPLLDLRDAVRIARKVAGLEPNP